jgi:dTDP-4-amino-4,6-dideoxyglucose formyltransferase
MTTRTLILTDNPNAYALALEINELYGQIDVMQSPKGPLENVPRINVRLSVAQILKDYDLVLSIHCKQLFPEALVNGVRCVNVHPGLNPHNRGWFPQVFSILNGLPSGVTIHEIDAQLDHGPIIASQTYKIESWDTSGSAYDKIMSIERELVLKHFQAIRDHRYQLSLPAEGNINFKKDFDTLKHIDLNEVGSFGDFINRLRALTHKHYNNAYFMDENGRKIFVKIALAPDCE